MTPAEADVAVKYSNKVKLNLLDNVSYAVYNAVGSSLGGKKWEPVFNRAEQEKKKQETRVTKEQKKAELEYLKNIFN